MNIYAQFPLQNSFRVISKNLYVLFFFFRDQFFFLFFFLVFFFLEKLKFTHSLVWKACFFFRWWKKKTAFLLTHTIFDQKWQKTNFSQKKKTLPLLGVKFWFPRVGFGPLLLDLGISEYIWPCTSWFWTFVSRFCANIRRVWDLIVDF